MKLFIGWSGERSNLVAKLLNCWIPCVIQRIEPWLSSSDLMHGKQWSAELSEQLASAQSGIICLTKSNLNEKWISYEAGALANGLSSSRVYIFLIDLESKNVDGPLAHFNHTISTKDSLFKLLKSINSELGKKKLKDIFLFKAFHNSWPEFEKKFKLILKQTANNKKQKTNPLVEILELQREIYKKLDGLNNRIGRLEGIPHRLDKKKDNKVTPMLDELV